MHPRVTLPGDLRDCARDRNGKAFGLTVRFGTGTSDAPVLRMLWRNENGLWRIRGYDLELP